MERIFKNFKQFGGYGGAGGGVSGVEMARWDPAFTAQWIKSRMERGYTIVTIDFGLELLRNVPNALAGSNMWDLKKDWTQEEMSYGQTRHPFSGLQITETGFPKMLENIARVREIYGYEIPIAADHFGNCDPNTAIRLGKAVVNELLKQIGY